MARIAMIGGTGLVGADLAARLVAAGHDLFLLGRRPAEIPGATDLVADIGQWSRSLDGLAMDVAISTLGTTRKAAGSMAAFEAIDRHAVTSFASAAMAAGARHWMMVSSVGADADSRNGYLAVKGRTEADVRALRFVRTDIFQPGLLIGDRKEKRAGERLAIRLSPFVDSLLIGRLDRYRSIPAAAVSAAMARLTDHDAPGVFVHQNRDIRVISGL